MRTSCWFCDAIDLHKTGSNDYLEGMKHTLLLGLALGALSLLLSSCMATKGLGQDMQILGEKIEHKADESIAPRTPPPSAGAYVAPPL